MLPAAGAHDDRAGSLLTQDGGLRGRDERDDERQKKERVFAHESRPYAAPPDAVKAGKEARIRERRQDVEPSEDAPMTRLAMLLSLLLAAAAHAAGDPDPTFGTNGVVALPFAAKALLALPDGHLVVAGQATTSPTVGTMALARYDARGVLDTSFGDHDGIAEPVPDGSPFANVNPGADAIALDDAGGIVVAGTTELGRGLVTRVDANGRLDAAFGSQGVLDLGSVDSVARVAVSGLDLAVAGTAPDGVVFERVRLGVPTLIGPSLAGGRATDMMLAADGSAIVAGSLDDRFLLLHRATVSGASSFGTNDVVETPVGLAAEIARLVPLPARDRRFVAVGITIDPPAGATAHVALARYTLDGRLDPAFGNGGVVVTSIATLPGGSSLLDAVRVPADGGVRGGDRSSAIMVGGASCTTIADCHGFLARFGGDGQLDPTFGDGGTEILPDVVPLRIVMPDAANVVALGFDDRTGAAALARFTSSTCGNGVIEPGEECDGGECCTAACTRVPDGSACTSDGDACTADVCNAGVCTHGVPVDAGCSAGSASLVVADGDGTDDHRVRLAWSSTTTLAVADFGDPTRDTTPTVCLVDLPGPGRRQPSVVGELAAPAAERCKTKPCWTRTGAGFRYRDALRQHDGVATLRLVSRRGHGRIALQAKGAPFGVPTLGDGDRLLVRVVRDDAPGCFESSLAATGTAAGRLTARSDSK